jgi:hypothetical protein
VHARVEVPEGWEWGWGPARILRGRLEDRSHWTEEFPDGPDLLGDAGHDLR